MVMEGSEVVRDASIAVAQQFAFTPCKFLCALFTCRRLIMLFEALFVAPIFFNAMVCIAKLQT